jgi:hypothetical protein
LRHGARTVYLGGFVSPAFCFHKVAPVGEYRRRCALLHRCAPDQPHRRDWYYVRVRERNNQWAWSSPIWVEAPLA